MYRNHIRTVFLMLVVLIMAWSIFSCQSESPADNTKDMIAKKTQDLFTRIKVRDYAVIWENEYPYMREDSPLEEYLNNAYMKWYKPDTLVAVQIDSVVLWDDTSANTYMELEWLLSDSSFKVDSIRLRWVHHNDEWLKPTLSVLDKQKEFEEELRVYWDAVKQKEQEQAQDTAGETGGK